MSANNPVVGGLRARVARLLPRVTYRRALTREYRNEIFRLRHDAYLREGAITAQPGGIFTDEVDEAENTHLFGLHVDGVLMSSIRISVTSWRSADIPTAHVFPDVLEPEIDAGKIIIDPTRFVVDHASSRLFPELPYLTLRLAWIAMEYYDADILLAAVRSEHVAFYRKFWNTTCVAPPRDYPMLSKPISLTMVDYLESRETVHSRYPFLASTSIERDRVFGAKTAKRRSEMFEDAGLVAHCASLTG